MSNIEDDIKKLNKFNEYENTVVLSEEALYEIQDAIEHILSEREQDKARIKELEEKNRMLALEGSRVRLDLYIKQNYIPKQKVKDVLQNNRNEIFSFTYVDDEQFKPYTMQIDRINKIEKELLEEGE